MKLFALRMKRSIRLALTLTGVFSFILAACQDNSNRLRPQGEITVKLPVLQNGAYKLSLVKLDTVDDLVRLSGGAAHFVLSPSQKNGQLVGFDPRIRTIRTSDGVYVAQDSQSMQMLSLYWNMENLMKMDDELKVKDVNVWPLTVAVQARVNTGGGNFSRDNARYSGELDAFLFEPYDRDDLPLAVNAGVIGHEHFHSLFYKMVLTQVDGFYTSSSTSSLHDDVDMARRMGLNVGTAGPTANNQYQIYQMTLLRGLNEGLADIWGWIYSGDTNFVERSLSFEKTRDLTLNASLIPSADLFTTMLDPADANSGNNLDVAYKLGSRYAQSIYQITSDAQVVTRALRMQVARAILRSLPRFRDELKALNGTQKLDPERLMEIISEELPFKSNEFCTALKAKVMQAQKDKMCAHPSAAALAEKNATGAKP